MTIEEFKKSVEVLKDEENMNINFMNKGDKFPWSDFEKEKIAIEIEKLLDKFYDKDDIPYNYTHNGVKKYVNISNENKQWMEATFAKHPNYDPTTHTIRLTREFSRIQDSEEIENFMSFLIDKIRIKIAKENEAVKPEGYENKEEIFNQYYALNNIRSAFSCFPYPRFVEYLGHDCFYWREKYDTIADKYNEIINFDNSTVSLLGEQKLVWVPCDAYNEYVAIQKIINSLRDVRYNRNQDNGRITSSFIDTMTNIRCNYRCSVDFMDIIHPVVGQKVSTIIKKIAMYYGIDKYTEEKTVEWVDSNTGEVKSKIKNVGWNYRFTQFCDKIKPFKKKMQVVISLNPIDYLTMSFGYGWASCQTIDKTNERGNDNNYEGCYSGGTVELGEDESTVVVYLLDADDKTETPYLNDKIKRCLFFMGEDKFVESRVYPDGRDGSDYTDTSRQLREVMTEVLEQCNNITEKGGWEEETKTHFEMLYIKDNIINAYHDFKEYPDIYSIRRKGFDKFKRINVGGECTCLSCSGSNHRAESIICEDCYEGESSETYAVCNRCGASIREYDDYECIEGEYYCCAECANDAGYVWSDYAERWVYEDDAFYDEYDGNYYLFEDGIEMSDGTWFGSDYNAIQYGYYHCEHCDRWVTEDEWNSELDCCTDCEEEIKEEEVA